MPCPGVIVLHGPGSIYAGRGTSGTQCCSATVVTRRAFGGGGSVTVWAGVYRTSRYRTALHFVNGTVTSPYYLNNIINPVIVPLHEQHGPNFIFMDDNAPAHRSRIIGERLLDSWEPQMEWPALSPDLNPIVVLYPPLLLAFVSITCLR